MLKPSFELLPIIYTPRDIQSVFRFLWIGKNGTKFDGKTYVYFSSGKSALSRLLEISAKFADNEFSVRFLIQSLRYHIVFEPVLVICWKLQYYQCPISVINASLMSRLNMKTIKRTSNGPRRKTKTIHHLMT